MKVDLTGGGVIALAAVAAVAGLGLWAYSKRKAVAQAAGAVVDAVNPASSDNLVNRGVSAVGEAITGEKDWTLGGWFYDATHREENAALAYELGPKASYDEAERLAARYPAPAEVKPWWQFW